MFSMTQDIACPSGRSTIIDRYDIWPQTVLIKDATAKTVTDTFFSTEVARFASQVGCEESRATVYRPPPNGILEQQHNRSHDWVSILPSVPKELFTPVKMQLNGLK